MPARRERTSEDVVLTREPSRDPSRWAMLSAAILAIAGLLIVPLACAPDLYDRFRIVKESILRIEAFLGLFLVIVAIAFGAMPRLREMLRERAVFAIAIAGIVWGVITTLASTHRLLSIGSLAGIVAAIVLFLVIWFAAPRVNLFAIDVLVVAAAVNGVLVTLQEKSIYNPFDYNPLLSVHLASTALLGNPNIVGSYLALVALILIAAATTIRGFRRVWYLAGACCAILGMLMSDTETAVVTLAAGVGLLAIGRSWKRGIALGVAVIVLLGIGVALRIPVVVELAALPKRISQHGLEVALSGRVAPSLVALRETKAHPISGIGPGTYGYHFMPERSRLTEESNGRVSMGLGMNFGEVHNDHLQILAETGIPGYLLFLGGVLAIVLAVLRTNGTGDRARLARTLAIPLAGAFLVLCLAQFPLQIAVTRHLILTMAGLIVGWSRA